MKQLKEQQLTELTELEMKLNAEKKVILDENDDLKAKLKSS